jgi:hypothetical protein
MIEKPNNFTVLRINRKPNGINRISKILYCLLYQQDFYFIWISRLLIMSLPDEDSPEKTNVIYPKQSAQRGK